MLIEAGKYYIAVANPSLNIDVVVKFLGFQIGSDEALFMFQVEGQNKPKQLCFNEVKALKLKEHYQIRQDV